MQPLFHRRTSSGAGDCEQVQHSGMDLLAWKKPGVRTGTHALDEVQLMMIRVGMVGQLLGSMARLLWICTG